MLLIAPHMVVIGKQRTYDVLNRFKKKCYVPEYSYFYRLCYDPRGIGNI